MHSEKTEIPRSKRKMHRQESEVIWVENKIAIPSFARYRNISNSSSLDTGSNPLVGSPKICSFAP